LQKLEELEKAKRKSPIFRAVRRTSRGKRAQDDDMEELAETLGGTRLLEGAWYFRFPAVSKEEMEMLCEKFGEPVEMDVVKHYKERQDTKEEREEKEELRKAVKAEVKRIFPTVAANHGGGKQQAGRGNGGNPNDGFIVVQKKKGKMQNFPRTMVPISGFSNYYRPLAAGRQGGSKRQSYGGW
jgi:hypothetical protein